MPSQWMREAGADAFATCTTFDSPFLRANSYAVLGAVEFLRSAPSHQAARALLERASGVLADAATTTIPWPESPATPDNARIPDVLMGAPVLSSPEKERRAAAEAAVVTLPAVPVRRQAAAPVSADQPPVRCLTSAA